MTCEECKEDRRLHSESIPLCEECYEDIFVLKSDIAVAKRINEQPNNVILMTKGDSGTHTLKFTENGDLLLDGRLLGNDTEVVEGLKRFLKLSGSL
jgi:hypothetical protein